MAEHGIARAAVLSSRDPTSRLPERWVQKPSASVDKFRRDSQDYADLARRNRQARLGSDGSMSSATPLRPDLGHCLHSAPGLSSPASSTVAAGSQAHPEAELAALRARVEQLAAAEASQFKRKQPGAKTPVARIGVHSADGSKLTVGRKAFDLKAVKAHLLSMGIDPQLRCLPWLLCHGDDAGRARAECLHFDLHSTEGEWHTLVPKFKSSDFDTSRTPEDRARIAARGAASRKNGAGAARVAKPGP